MPLKWKPIPVPLTGGLDSRTDPKALSPMDLGVCENVVFTTPGSARKRFGSSVQATLDGTSGVDASINSGRTLAARGDELVMLDNRTLLSTGAGMNRWIRRQPFFNSAVTGSIAPASPSLRPVPKLRQDMTLADRATTNGLTAYSWVDDQQDLWFTVLNATTGETVFPPTAFPSITAMRTRVLAFGTSFIFLFSNDTSGTLSAATADSQFIYSGSRTAPPVVQIANDLNTTTSVWDAVLSGSRVLIAYNTSTASTLKIGYVDLNGNADGGFITQATAVAPTVLSVSIVPTTGSFLVAWGMNSNNHVDARGFDVTKTALFASTTINSSDTAFANMTSIWSPIASKWVVFWELTGASNYLNTTWYSTITLAGSTPATHIRLARHSGLASKPWIVYDTGNAPSGSAVGSTGVHVLVVQDSTFQTTYFALRIDDSAICARFFPGSAGGVTPKAHLPAVETLATQAGVAADGSTGTTFGLVLLQRTRIGTGASFFDRAIWDCTLAFGANAIPRAVVGNALYFAGGILAEYDGTNICEHGFLLFPENVSIAQGGGGSLTLLATYSYRVYFEFLNALGQRELSTALTFNVTLTGGNQTATLTIPTLAHTMKGSLAQRCAIVVYRTTANPPPTGAVYYRVSNPNPSTNGATNGYLDNSVAIDTQTFTDQLADAAITAQEPDYLSQFVMDNVALPACTALATSKNRAFAALAEDPDVIWASKLRTTTNAALEWSDENILRLPSGYGPVTGIAVMADQIIIFRQNQIYLTGGEGPDNTGSGGSFDIPRTIADDVGCTNGRSIVRTPAGIMFKSAKGLYLLAPDLSLTYIGAKVEGFNSETIVAATLLSNVHEVRFACASGKTLVYNYAAGQWSVFTGVGGVDACLWQNRYTWLADATGRTLVETAGVFQDGLPAGQTSGGTAIVMAIETAFLKFAGLQGYQRIREVMCLGDFKSPHSIRMRVALDYEPDFTEDFAIDISSIVGATKYGDDAFYGQFSASQGGNFGGNVAAAGAGGLPATNVYQFSISLRRQKCESIKIRIEDTKRIDPAGVIDYPLLESFRLTEMSLNVGVKAGLHKVGADRSFG